MTKQYGNFQIRNSIPKITDKYISYYIRKGTSKNGISGQSQCIFGYPQHAVANVLSNCVGYACGRFNEIYSQIMGTTVMKYPTLNITAKELYKRGAELGLKVGTVPKPGCLLVWDSYTGDASGHVEVCESVIDEYTITASSSAYGSSNYFRYKTLSNKRSNLHWGYFNNFIGCVYNPAVKTNDSTTILHKGIGELTIDSLCPIISWDGNASTIGKFLTTAPRGNKYDVYAVKDTFTTTEEQSWMQNVANNIKHIMLVNYSQSQWSDCSSIKLYSINSSNTEWVVVPSNYSYDIAIYKQYDTSYQDLINKLNTNTAANIGNISNLSSGSSAKYNNSISLGADGTGLLTDQVRVQVPYIKVTIGDYTFGANARGGVYHSDSGTYTIADTQFPNYIHSLTVDKINGEVNQYKLSLSYNVNQYGDPNFIEKVLGSVGLGGKIYFTYGDCSSPEFLYKEEEAIITGVSSTPARKGNILTYSISAISSGDLLSSMRQNFNIKGKHKPSDILKDIIKNKKYGIADVFQGMRDYDLVISKGLIESTDKEVELQDKQNTTTWDYIKYLVKSMSPNEPEKEGSARVYDIIIVDDVSGDFDGSYFKVRSYSSSLTSDIETTGMYTIDVGYPSSDLVLDFNISSDYTPAIYTKFNTSLTTDNYARTINNNGEIEYTYKPLALNNAFVDQVTQANINWMAQVTSYPISGTLKLQGLLKPALLMQYLKINVYYFGQKHSSSGIYVVTKQQDSISSSGFKTTLNVTRVKGDSDVSVDADMSKNSDVSKSYLKNLSVQTLGNTNLVDFIKKDAVYTSTTTSGGLSMTGSAAKNCVQTKINKIAKE